MYAVILAGGSGTRLWPLSRERFPKQYLNLISEHQSLFQETLSRVLPVVPERNILIVAHQEQEALVRHQLGTVGAERATLLKEPKACNTAPAIGLAAWHLSETSEPDAVMAVLPSDHLIPSGKEFTDLLLYAARSASDYGLVTFGIRPGYPETGYGYIRCGKQLNQQTYLVEEFVEKPDMERAEQYVKDSRFLWNSGMFVFKVDELIMQYRCYLPDISALLDEVDYQTFSNLETVYEKMPVASIDYGLLEKSEKTTVVPTDIAWSDLGSWDAFYRVAAKDDSGNYIRGKTINVDAQQNLIFSQSRLVSTIGIENLIIVDTDDALLVCSRERSQEVKKIVALLKEKKAVEAESHRTVHRSWGSLTLLKEGAGYRLKRIAVNPGSLFSCKGHHYCSKHWVVFRGEAKVTIGDEEKRVETGKHIFIPINARHCLENPGECLLEVIEVQNSTALECNQLEDYDDESGGSNG